MNVNLNTIYVLTLTLASFPKSVSGRLSPDTSLYIFGVLEWQERHEIRVVHDVGFRRSLYQVAFSRMCGDDVTNFVRHAALER